MLSEKKIADMYYLLDKEVVPALGCTEPIALALAVARAAEELRTLAGADVLPEKMEIMTSLGIYKNGMGVGIPGTDKTGLYIAAALGAIVGDSSKELEVLAGVHPDDVEKANDYVSQGRISIGIQEKCNPVFVDVVCTAGENTTHVVLAENHRNIILVEANGKVVFENKESAEEAQAEDDAYNITMAEIYEFASTQPFEKIRFILDAAQYNKRLSDYGLKNHSGMGLGATLLARIEKNHGGNEFADYAMALTAAASDARMSGALLPAMSNSGSGNQGITAMMPVLAVAERMGASDELLARALMVSNLTVIHIKHGFGRLSAACGCVVASSGAASGVCYLKGGTEQQITYAVKNMIGNLTGMVCDGAKLGCALKVASGTSAAMQAAILALENIYVPGTNGIVEDDVEKTIRNIGYISSKAMTQADNVILEIMVNKDKPEENSCGACRC